MILMFDGGDSRGIRGGFAGDSRGIRGGFGGFALFSCAFGLGFGGIRPRELWSFYNFKKGKKFGVWARAVVWASWGGALPIVLEI